MQAPVTVSNGLAAQMNNLLTNLSDPVSGRFQQVDNGYQASLTDIAKQITQQNAYIQLKTTQLQDEFAAMEQTLAKLQAASSAINSFTQTLSSSLNNGTSTTSSSGSSNSSGFNVSTGS